jgi:5'-nucleotidase
MRILLTNDDGIGAPGLEVLARNVARWIDEAPAHEVREAIVVAPSKNHSGMSAAVGDVFSHPSVTYERRTIPGAESLVAYSLEAPPALCAILGAVGSFEFQPDMILSGINAGANVGRSVLHSGTVGAILTGAQLGLSGLAVSVQWGEDVHYDTAGEVAIEVLQELMNAPARTLFNLNVPNLSAMEMKGVRRELTLRLGAATPDIGDVSDEDADEDGALLVAGYASLTPLRGPHEDADPGLDGLVHSALEAIARHLNKVR